VTDELLVIRQARQDDDAALLALEGTAWESHLSFPSFRGKVRESFFNDRSGPESVLVAEYDGELAGYARLHDKYPMIEGAGVLSLNGLAVVPSARRRGVGSALLDAVTTEAKRRGARKISLLVFGTNTVAQRLYERHGYVIEARRTAEFLIEGEYVDDLELAKFL
jgi:ribosomal protein S18 acetylase RimI-like enzyme